MKYRSIPGNQVLHIDATELMKGQKINKNKRKLGKKNLNNDLN